MPLLEIELNRIRPHREYWGPLGNHQWQLFYTLWKLLLRWVSHTCRQALSLLLSLDSWKEHTLPSCNLFIMKIMSPGAHFARNLQQVSASGHEACPSNARVQHPCKKCWKDNSLLIFFYPTCFQPLPLFSKRSHGSGGPVFASPGWRMFFLVFLSNKMENQLTFESLPV